MRRAQIGSQNRLIRGETYRVAWNPALSVHLAGINVRIDHNNLSVLLGKSFALVGGGCTAECCCRSVARCAASSYCRSFVSRATEISRSGTLRSRRVALPLQFTLRAHPVARFLSCDAPPLSLPPALVSNIPSGYTVRLTLDLRDPILDGFFEFDEQNY